MDSVRRRSVFRVENVLSESSKRLASEVRVIEFQLTEFIARLDPSRDALAVQYVEDSLAEINQFLQQTNLPLTERSSLCGTKVRLEELTPTFTSQRLPS